MSVGGGNDCPGADGGGGGGGLVVVLAIPHRAKCRMIRSMKTATVNPLPGRGIGIAI